MKTAAETAMRPLSDLDGPLSHLLMERNAAWLALEKAKLNLEQFMAACEVIREEAAGRTVNRESLPLAVQGLIKQIHFRSAEKAVKFSPQPLIYRHD